MHSKHLYSMQSWRVIIILLVSCRVVVICTVDYTLIIIILLESSMVVVVCALIHLCTLFLCLQTMLIC